MQPSLFSTLFLLANLLLSTPLLAKNIQTLSQSTHRILKSNQELLARGKTKDAILHLGQLLVKISDNPYERAVTLQTRAHAYLAQEAYKKAIIDFKESLALNVLPLEVQQRLRYNLAQLYMMTQHYSEAVLILNTWFQQEPDPKPKAYALLGSAHFQLSHYQQAIDPLQKAVARSLKPKESWYQGLLAAYYEIKDYDACEELLQTMLRLFPHRGTLWRQLAGILLIREKQREALPVMALAYLSGHLEKESDLLNLAQLYMNQEAPFKAGKLLEKEIGQGNIESNKKNNTLMANAWLQAKEKKRATIALKHIWKKYRQPKDGLNLARFFLENKQWEKAEVLLSTLLNTTTIDDDRIGNTWLLLGIARFEKGLQEKSQDAFLQATKHINTRKDAEQWLIFLKAHSSMKKQDDQQRS